jgi:hypothetical protein
MTGPRLRVNPIPCDAYGHCAELLAELVRADEWGYPGGLVDPTVGGSLRACVASVMQRLSLQALRVSCGKG